jgi:hypothetical protein
MQPKRYRILYLLCLSLSIACMGLSCADGPKVATYVSTPTPSNIYVPSQYGCIPQAKCQAGLGLYNGKCVPVTAGPNTCAGGGMEYYDERTKVSGFVPYSATGNFTCFNPTDTQTLLNYCASK